MLSIAILTLCFQCSNLLADIQDHHEIVFTAIYNDAIWGRNDRGEGYSGGGSLWENAKIYIDFLQKFIKQYDIKTVVDAGCGDWECSRYIDWSQVQYMGYDVVAHIIKKDKERYGAPNISFIHGNFLTIDLPRADLLLSKHVLQHLSNEDILKFLPQLSKYKYCLITNAVDVDTLSSENVNIVTGGGQKIDLSRPPFNIFGIKILNYLAEGTMHQVFFIDNSKQK